MYWNQLHTNLQPLDNWIEKLEIFSPQIHQINQKLTKKQAYILIQFYRE